ncbi:MAG: lysophospholipase [Leeuwenhoekiella sp.]
MSQNILSEEFTVNTSRHKLHGKRWNVAPAKAIVCIIHGFGEHLERYNFLAKQFNNHQISCYALDLPGHGKSEGKRGNIRSLNDYMLAIDAMYQEAINDNPEIPVVLYGHSMGGALVARYLLITKLAPEAAVITSPWLELVRSAGAVQTILGQMAMVVGLNSSQKSNLNPEDLSRDRQVAIDYKADNLVHNQITPRTYFALRDNGSYILNMEYELPCPVLLAHGDDDKITETEASVKWAKRHPETITLKIWKGLRHETHNELNKIEVIDFYAKWILDQV